MIDILLHFTQFKQRAHPPEGDTSLIRSPVINSLCREQVSFQGAGDSQDRARYSDAAEDSSDIPGRGSTEGLRGGEG